MALTFAQVKSYSRPNLLAAIPEEKIKLLQNDKLVDSCNFVQNAINQICEINIEYFRQGTTDSETNYVLRGPIARIFEVTYKVTNYKNVSWARVQRDADGYGRIVLREEPSEGIMLGVKYLRECLNIDGEDTDVIDLPEFVLTVFVDLVILRVLVDLGVAPQADYDAKFSYVKDFIKPQLDYKNFLPKHPNAFWLGLPGDSFDHPADENFYDITQNEVGGENITADALGHYYWVGE